jgi:hypothetical protein
VLRLILALVDIMLHRRGPDSLPSSPFLFWLLLAAMLATSFGASAVAGTTVREAAALLLIIGFEFWFVWAVLFLFQRQRRFRQTMSAVLGTDAILTALTIPLIPFTEQAAPASERFSAASLVITAFEIWSILILAFVLSRALDRPYLLTVAVSIAYVFLMAILYGAMVPRPA